MKKYEPLGTYLANLDGGRSGITLTFKQIEKIIKDELPNSAYEYPQWWSNQMGGSRAPHWRNAGFYVDSINLEQQIVTFRRIGNVAEPNGTTGDMWLENPNIIDVTDAIEKLAPKYAIGNLQRIRQQMKGSKICYRTIFGKKSISEKGEYAYHYGGRTELQFNVGFEDDENGEWKLRHGLAISLRGGHILKKIDETIRTRIARLNDYIESHAEELTDFFMYESEYDTEEWSGYHAVRPIPQEAIKLDMFIFIGKHQSPQRICTDLILRDFDRLLPVYEFVQSHSGVSFFQGAYGSVPEITQTGEPSSTTATVEAAIRKVELRHFDIQTQLMQHLVNLHGSSCVYKEYDSVDRKRVDLVVKEDHQVTYYEIKICDSAQQCIRQAIGQLLEYSYWPGAEQATRLIVVGEPELDSAAREYLVTLDEIFNLRIFYLQFDWKSGCKN